MMFSLSLIFFILSLFLKDGVTDDEKDVRFLVEIWNIENKTDICFGVVVAPQIVIMSSCSWFKNSDVDLSKIILMLGDEEKYIKEIRISDIPHLEDFNEEPLILLISHSPFISKIYPVSINGGDLIETCQEAKMIKYVKGPTHTRISGQYETFTHMARDVNPLPYEACKRISEDLVFHKNEFCVVEVNKSKVPIQPEGSPVLCDSHLTGLKLYSKNLTDLPNHTLHVYIRMSPYINWLSDLRDLKGAPIWVFLESEYEEKMILGEQLSLLLRNSKMPKWKSVFVTGGAGYIGSHCIVELLESGYQVVAVDNFANSVSENGEAVSLKRVENITGKPVYFYKCDLLDKSSLQEIFNKYKIDCVIHLAALKAVGESMQNPFMYYENNIIATINLLEVMKEVNCQNLVFSSSSTVYGDPEYLPVTENHPTGNVTNVYGPTKYFIEEMLKDLSAADENWNIISLRYFNPVGAHPSGIIGEDPTKQIAL